MKITTLELANVKRIKALRLEPSPNGLTIIGGANGQGKTSVLDAIAYAVGGQKYKPSNLKREGAVGETIIHIETDNGLIIERKGKNAALTVTDKTGAKQGQALLSKLISEFAIDLPRFHNSNSKEKAAILLHTLGIEEQLNTLAKNEKAKFDMRHLIGREADQKDKAAKDMPYYEGLPDEPISIKDLLDQQQAILARNGVKEAAKKKLDANKAMLTQLQEQMKTLTTQIDTLTADIKNAETEDYTTEDTSEIEANIKNFEETNRKIHENAERARRENEADNLHDQYDALTAEIEDIRKRRDALLENAEFPLEGLSIGKDEKGENILLLNGKAWDCMSGSEQLIVDCAIASKLNRECRFVLLDKLEQLDLETLQEFGKWLEAHDLQCIATRVSNNHDGECSIIICDGEAEVPEGTVVIPAVKKEEPKPLTDEDY